MAALAATLAVVRMAKTIDRPAVPVDDRARADVARAYDGDTLSVRLDGRTEKVRLVGVDTPERGQPFYSRATEFTRAATVGRTVTLDADPMSDDRDRHGRLLRYVVLEDGRVLGEELVRAGLGGIYTGALFERRDRYLALEADARAAGRGMWAPDAIARVDWREAPRHAGAVVETSGEIVATRNIGKFCFLNFHTDHRSNLTVVIRGWDLARFPEPPESAYRGRMVRVTGLVTEFDGRPQIEIQGPDQIEILD